jgi:hypothetical protein
MEEEKGFFLGEGEGEEVDKPQEVWRRVEKAKESKFEDGSRKFRAGKNGYAS